MERERERERERESGFDFGYLDFWWLFYDGSTLIFGGSNVCTFMPRRQIETSNVMWTNGTGKHKGPPDA